MNRPNYHIVEFRTGEWSIQHEEKCFENSLLDCPVHVKLRDLQYTPVEPGRYKLVNIDTLYFEVLQ